MNKLIILMDMILQLIKETGIQRLVFSANAVIGLLLFELMFSLKGVHRYELLSIAALLLVILLINIP